MKFITLTNKGYLDYTRNMIISLKKLDIATPLKVYCIGEECYDELDYDDKELLLTDAPDDYDDGQLCSGIMYIKCNDKNKQTFNPANIDINNFKCDQIYLNEIKAGLKYDKLPLKKYPNGQYFYNRPCRQGSYCIHFNYLVGHEKKETMKKLNYWFL